MNRIILARHGRPAWDYSTRIPGHGLAMWLRGEREAPLDPGSRPDPVLEELARNAAFVIASPLRRSIDSARLLSPSRDLTIEDDVQEAALPSAFGSDVHLPPNFWAAIARTRWFFGWCPGVESVAAARQRAARAARTLEDLAPHGDIVVIGHGLMNALIAAQLGGLGRGGPAFPWRRHWAFGTYTARQLA
jgi:broad specificity phosphatase PhoE